MKARVSLALAGILFVIAGNAATGPYIFNHVVELAGRVGARPAGSPQEATAAAYIAAQLASYGYSVSHQAFSFQMFHDQGSEIAIHDEGGRKIVTRTLAYSPPGDIEAQIVEAGSGGGEEYGDLNVTGKLVLVRRGEITFLKKAQEAAIRGAAGLIVYNNSDGLPRGGTLGEAGPIPAVIISGRDGEAIKERVSGGPVKARLIVRSSLEPKSSANVIAQWPGEEQTRIVVGAHYDSVAGSPGANDNASGVAVMLAVAHRIAGTPAASGTAFVAFGAEEPGLRGSQAFVDRIARPTEVSAMINLDSLGGGRRIGVYGDSRLVSLLKGLGLPGFMEARPSGPQYRSDHVPFSKAGVPSVMIGAGSYGEYHTDKDRPEIIEEGYLEENARLLEGLIKELSRQP